MLQIYQTHRGMELRVFSVNSHPIKLFCSCVAKIPHILHTLMPLFILCKDRSTLHRMEQFGSMKTSCTDITKIKNRSPLISSTKTMGRIINNFQIILRSEEHTSELQSRGHL